MYLDYSTIVPQCTWFRKSYWISDNCSDPHGHIGKFQMRETNRAMATSAQEMHTTLISQHTRTHAYTHRLPTVCTTPSSHPSVLFEAVRIAINLLQHSEWHVCGNDNNTLTLLR